MSRRESSYAGLGNAMYYSIPNSGEKGWKKNWKKIEK